MTTQQDKVDPKRKYSVGEVASLLRVTEEVVRRYLRSRKLRGLKETVHGIKNEWRILGKDILSFMAKYSIAEM